MNELSVKIFNHVPTKFGIKAVVGCFLGKKEIYRDEINLWQAKSRERFVRRCTRRVVSADQEPSGK